MRKLKLLTLTTLIVLGTAGVAAATTITATLTPNTPKKGSEVRVTATGFPQERSAPTALTIDLQRGFTTATAKKAFGIYRPGWADSVKALCSVQDQNSDNCAGASTAKDSLVGRGSAQVVVSSPPLVNDTVPINVAMYLGVPPAGGCPAAVEIVFQVASTSPILAGQSAATNGTLCRHSGGLEVKFNQLPNLTSGLPVPATTTYTVKDLTLSAGASNLITTKRTKIVKKHKKTVRVRTRVYLLNNPPACPSTGAWSQNSFTVAFNGSTVTEPLSFTCKKK